MKAIAGFGLAGVLAFAAMTTGLTTSVSGSVGNVSCFSFEMMQACTPGKIKATSIVTGDATPPPGGWTIQVSKVNCDLPPGSTTFVLAASGDSLSGPLPVFTDAQHTAACVYALTEVPVEGWTPTFTPSASVTMSEAFFDEGVGAYTSPVTITNASAAAGNPDSDGDGLTDLEETTGIPMGQRVRSARCPAPAIGVVKTDPHNPDSDGDGLTDGAEVHGTQVNQRVVRIRKGKLKRVINGTYFSNPLVVDTDCDGLSDAAEVHGRKTRSGFCRSDPSNFNTDFGRTSDGAEIKREPGFPENPCRPD